jgi:hypothetical protein
VRSAFEIITRVSGSIAKAGQMPFESQHHAPS